MTSRKSCSTCQSLKEESAYCSAEWKKTAGDGQCQDCCSKKQTKKNDGNEDHKNAAAAAVTSTKSEPSCKETNGIKKKKEEEEDEDAHKNPKKRASVDDSVAKGAKDSDDNDGDSQDSSPKQKQRKRRRRQPPKKARAARRTLYDDDSDDDDSDESDNDNADDNELTDTPGARKRSTADGDEEYNVSLKSLKRQVIGRDLVQDSPTTTTCTRREDDQIRALHKAAADSNDNDDDDSKSAIAQKLAKELCCAICQDIFYPPVSLPCGHSYCMACLDWWFHNKNNSRINHNACPTCRQPLHCPKTSLRVNVALKQTVMTLFAPQLVERIEAQKKQKLAATKGEGGGAHGRGYQRLSQRLEQEAWKALKRNGQDDDDDDDGNHQSDTHKMRARRSVVLDADDQRLQLALALYERPRFVVDDDKSKKNASLQIQVCLVHMEEDEVEADGGFPLVIEPDSDDLHVVCTMDDRFVHSFVLEVQLKTKDGTVSALARLANVESPGFLKFTLQPPQALGEDENDEDEHDDGDNEVPWQWDNVDSLLFCHTQTKAELELQFQKEREYKIPRRPRNKNDDSKKPASSFVLDQQDEAQEVEDGPTGKNLDHYEADGFLVGDEEEIEMDEEEDEHDLVDRRHGYHHRHDDDDDDNAMSEVDEEAEFSSAAEDGDGQYGRRNRHDHDDHDDHDEEEDEVDDDDYCHICKDGGELMICDGGDELPGCSKSFHAGCVGRDKIPEGDWVCQSCAEGGGFFDSGAKGHEFPVEEEAAAANSEEGSKSKTDGRTVELDSGSDNDEQEEEEKERPKAKSKNRKRVVIDDSDSD